MNPKRPIAPRRRAAQRTAGSQQRVVMPRLEAIDLVALRIDAINKTGTPEHAKASKLADDAVKIWRDQFHNTCPHCGARHNAEVSDVCPPLASETEKPRTGTRSLL